MALTIRCAIANGNSVQAPGIKDELTVFGREGLRGTKLVSQTLVRALKRGVRVACVTFSSVERFPRSSLPPLPGRAIASKLPMAIPGKVLKLLANHRNQA